MSKVILSDKVWIHREEVNLKKIKKDFELRMYEEKDCAKCEYLPDRHCDTCEDCPSFIGNYILWNKKEIGDKLYVGLPRGDVEKIKKYLPKHVTYINKRVAVPFRTKIQFYEKRLYEYQTEAIDEMEKNDQGQLQSKPRTGKTVMGSALAIRLGLKTLIIAHQNDLLEQFEETLRDPVFTNIASLEEQKGRKLIGICKSIKDFQRYDICLVTYQQFLSKKGRRKLNKISKLFGTVIIDEVHKQAADCYSRVISGLRPKYLYGMTATPKRKDGKHVLVMKSIGSVVHKTSAKSLIPYVTLHKTGVYSAVKFTGRWGWTKANRFLERHEKRNKLILSHLKSDLKNKKNSIVIPVTFKSQAENLVRSINQMYGRDIAIAFTGAVTKKDQRKKILDGARSGKYRVVVAMRRMLLGINVPRWNLMYEIAPIANEPNFEQELNRICTPMDDKPTPQIRFFVDESIGLSVGCFRVCFRTFQKEKIRFDKPSQEVLSQILKGQTADRKVETQDEFGRKRTVYKDKNFIGSTF